MPSQSAYHLAPIYSNTASIGTDGDTSSATTSDHTSGRDSSSNYTRSAGTRSTHTTESSSMYPMSEDKSIHTADHDGIDHAAGDVHAREVGQEADPEDMWDILAALSQAKGKESVTSARQRAFSDGYEETEGQGEGEGDLASLLGALKGIEPPSHFDADGSPVEIPHFPALSEAMLNEEGIRTSGKYKFVFRPGSLRPLSVQTARPVHAKLDRCLYRFGLWRSYGVPRDTHKGPADRSVADDAQNPYQKASSKIRN